MSNVPWTIRLAALSALTSVALVGGGAGVRFLKGLVSSADIIVTGTPSRAVASAGVASFSVNVERVLKGQAASGSTLFVAADLPSNTQTANQASRGLFFLKSAGGGPLHLISPLSGDVGDLARMYFALPKTAGPVATSATNDVRENVFLELLAAQEQGAGRGGAPFFPVEEYRLGGLRSMKAIFARYRKSPDPAMKTIGLRAGILDGDAACIRNLRAGVQGLPARDRGAVLRELISSYHSRDIAAIAALGSLANNPNEEPDIRAAAAHALAKVHTRECLPFLAPLLDSGELPTNPPTAARRPTAIPA